MNIAMISYWSCPLTRPGVLKAGGMNIYILNLIYCLGRLGHKIDVYTRTHKKKDEKLITIHRNTRIIHLTSFDINSYEKRIVNYINDNNLKYDLIHSHYYYSGLIGCSLKEKLSIPLVMTFHTLGVMKKIYLHINDKKRIEHEKKIARCADGIIVSTKLESHDLIRYYNVSSKKIFVVSPGVNHNIFKRYDRNYSCRKLNLEEDKKIIVFIGRIDPVKRINLLIEAVAKLSKIYPSFKNKFLVLLIGGDIGSREFWKNKEVKKIRYLIAKKDLECCVKFIGSQPHHLLPFYYSAADVVVMPSIYESFGFVVLEALACGSTVLASKTGGVTFLIKDKENGRYFKSENYDNLSEILWELLNDDKQRIRLGNNALKSVRNYSWEKQAEETLGVYKSLL
uniref:Glycosyltransferase n=1 Tax=candidate division CPR3 bacterium TaxID=2268181 RepID=A0A7C4M0T9_UNCC3